MLVVYPHSLVFREGGCGDILSPNLLEMVSIGFLVLLSSCSVCFYVGIQKG